MNVDIFMGMNFREFAKISTFACIIFVFLILLSILWHNKSYFHDIHIFADISEMRITRKYVQREHFYILSISNDY